MLYLLETHCMHFTFCILQIRALAPGSSSVTVPKIRALAPGSSSVTVPKIRAQAPGSCSVTVPKTKCLKPCPGLAQTEPD